jgi:hypothetical protein
MFGFEKKCLDSKIVQIMKEKCYDHGFFNMFKFGDCSNFENS